MTAHATAPFTDLERQTDAARLGMWIFIGTEVLFFGPLFMAYVYGRFHFPEAFADASRHTDVALGTLNTAVLLTSSFTMALAAQARQQNAVRFARAMLFATALLGAAFLAIKGFEYWKDWDAHLVPGASFALDGDHGAQLFFYLYFVMTGLHALHLAIGMTIVLIFAALLARGRDAAANAERLEIAALYWHFVDVVWIFLYPILYLVGRAPS